MKTRVLCAGTFDTLHHGHMAYLKSAKALAENSELIVIVATDSVSKKIKHKIPVNNEETRLEKIRSLEFVDEAVLGFEGNRMIERVISLKPDIIALGYDQWPNEYSLKQELEENGLNVKIIRMPKFSKD